MRIESIDFFYISMPVVTDAGDGSQDALLVRVRSGHIEAWGECEASPLTSIASSIAPMSHGACRPVSAQVLGEDVSSPKDIARLAATIQWNCMDLLQAAHTWSGIEIALWDLLGKKENVPVYKLLGYDKAYPKVPYASQLFGDTAQETLMLCKAARDAGYRAVKCGWGPFGRGTLKDDADHLQAAREGIGKDGTLLIDAGQIFGEDVDAAAARLPALEGVNATWLEEPFNGSAYEAYGALAKRSRTVRLAGGEAAHHAADLPVPGAMATEFGRHQCLEQTRPLEQVEALLDEALVAVVSFGCAGDLRGDFVRHLGPVDCLVRHLRCHVVVSRISGMAGVSLRQSEASSSETESVRYRK